MKMWLDEFYTLHMSRRASLGEIVKAPLEGCDGAPPLYAMTIHAILPWVRHEALAVRLPATLGFRGWGPCVLAFCRRRLPAVDSWVAALLACFACLPYSTEGRGYGIALCCGADAPLCRQLAADASRGTVAIPLLAFRLAPMTARHCSSIFLLIPLVLAETVSRPASGKVDAVILTAIVPVLLVLGRQCRLIAAGKTLQGQSWSPLSGTGFRRCEGLT